MKIPSEKKLSDMAFALAKAYERELHPDLKIGDNLLYAPCIVYGLSSVFLYESRYLHP